MRGDGGSTIATAPWHSGSNTSMTVSLTTIACGTSTSPSSARDSRCAVYVLPVPAGRR